MDRAPKPDIGPNARAQVRDKRRAGSGRAVIFSPALVLIGGIFLGVLLGGAAVYLGLERPAIEAAKAHLLQYEQDQAALRGHLTKAHNDVAALEGQLLIEASTRRGLETALHTAQTELGHAHDTIAFYEQLNPPGPKGAVTIRALEIEPSGPHLKYRVLLMRSGANGQAFEGSLQFLASGQANGKEIRVELEPAGDSARSATAASTLALEFTEFQRSSGLLGVPDGFVPEKITLNVLEGKTLRSSREVKFPPSR